MRMYMAPHVNRVNQINWREPLLENYYRLQGSPGKKRVTYTYSNHMVWTFERERTTMNAVHLHSALCSIIPKSTIWRKSYWLPQIINLFFKWSGQKSYEKRPKKTSVLPFKNSCEHTFFIAQFSHFFSPLWHWTSLSQYCAVTLFIIGSHKTCQME